MGVHVFDTMGTTVSLRLAGAAASASASVLGEVERAFRMLDERFSLYRTDSEISLVARGELRLTRASTDLREAYAEALEWSVRTGGAFTPHRPDGVVDLSGTIKATAMDASARVLDSAGEGDWMLVAGGDILTRGTLDGLPWRAGVVDPGDRSALLCAVELTAGRPALATSGTAERGEHIWRAGAAGASGSRPRYRQVTVRAADIVTADVLATALVAAGPEGCQELLHRFDVDVVTVDDDGRLTATPALQDAWGLTPA